MGQIYSFLGYENTVENNYHEAILCENFSCRLCWEVLTDPVQCQEKEDYFCRVCITRFLGSSQTCPLCKAELTVETLKPPSRIVDRVVSQLRKPRCSSVSTVVDGETRAVSGQIFIFGGGYNDEIGKSVEVFNWSTKTWTIVKDCLFLNRQGSFSFVYGKKILVCGGDLTEKIEYLNPSKNGYTSTVASVSLPDNAGCNGLLYEDRILTFYNGVVETSLELPGRSKTLLQEEICRNSPAGVHRFGNSICIVGGRENSMEKYDVVTNEMQMLPSLPYRVNDMASVVYKDNIILIGGCDGFESLNEVVMFNVTKQEYTRLPSMLEKRRSCAAVSTGDVIVAMGGENRGIESEDDNWTSLKTVEYYVIGDSTWQELPVMNLARVDATACVYKRT